jgi:hypothetical protein
VKSPPKFVEKLAKKMDIIASNQFKYQLPISGNKEEYVTHDTTLPSFIGFTFPEYAFSPFNISDLGYFTIKGKLCNQHASTNFSFNINVTN